MPQLMHTRWSPETTEEHCVENILLQINLDHFLCFKQEKQERKSYSFQWKDVE